VLQSSDVEVLMPFLASRYRACPAHYCSELQWVAVSCSVLQCVAVCCSVLQYVVMSCSMLKCMYCSDTHIVNTLAMIQGQTNLAQIDLR